MKARRALGIAGTAAVAGLIICRRGREHEALRVLSGTRPQGTPGLTEGTIQHGTPTPAMTDSQAMEWGTNLAGSVSLDRLTWMNVAALRAEALLSIVGGRGSFSRRAGRARLRALNICRVFAAALRVKADDSWQRIGGE